MAHSIGRRQPLKGISAGKPGVPADAPWDRDGGSRHLSLRKPL